MEQVAVRERAAVQLTAGRRATLRTRRARVVALAVLAIANAGVIVAIWLRGGGIANVGNFADALTSVGRLTALLGAYLALIAVLLIARVPPLERAVGFDRLTGWHRKAARICLALLLAHAALSTAGLALGDHVSLMHEIGRLITSYPGVITAAAGLALLCAVAVSSGPLVRPRLRYETWYFVHLYTYLAVALAFSHQIATGSDFVGAPAARAYWAVLYLATLGALVLFRIAVPLLNAARHRLRVECVLEEVPGVVTIEITGRQLGRIRAQPGQFFLWRFLTTDRWWQAHPFSLSAAPDNRRLRITVRERGDFTRSLRSLPPGARVLVEGPFGTFTAESRLRADVVLIAGGTGITPIRALLETLPGGPGQIVVVYHAPGPQHLLFREELDVLAHTRDFRIHYLFGGEDELSPDALARLVPDLAERDAFVCGPPGMVDATRASLGQAGVPARHIFTERFAF